MSNVKELFEQLNSGLQDPTVKADAKKTNAIFSFDFKSGGKYFIDLKNDGVAGEGAAPAGKKADITMTMDQQTFLDLASGKGNAQKLFMQGKIKIKGNMMKATALGDVLKKAQAQTGKSKL